MLKNLREFRRTVQENHIGTGGEKQVSCSDRKPSARIVPLDAIVRNERLKAGSGRKQFTRIVPQVVVGY